MPAFAMTPSFQTERAMRAQTLLSGRVIIKPLRAEPRTVAAVDVSYIDEKGFGTAVLTSFPECDLLTSSTHSTNVSVPYIAGFLAFRETRPIVCALRRLEGSYDVLLVNGHGRAHPRHYGLASHIGVLLNVPTIGIAIRPLGDPLSPYNVGNLIMIRNRCFVSVGHMLELNDAARIVRTIDLSGRETPLHMAHRLSKEAMKHD